MARLRVLDGCERETAGFRRRRTPFHAAVLEGLRLSLRSQCAPSVAGKCQLFGDAGGGDEDCPGAGRYLHGVDELPGHMVVVAVEIFEAEAAVQRR